MVLEIFFQQGERDASSTESVTEGSIIADIEDRSDESVPGYESDGEQEVTLQCSITILERCRRNAVGCKKFPLSRQEVPVDLFEAAGKFQDSYISIANYFRNQIKITDFLPARYNVKSVPAL